MKRILAVSLFLFSAFFLHAEDFPFGSIDYDAIDMKQYAKDTSANAVVIQEFGTTRFNNRGGNSIIFQHHVKIKVFNSKKFTHSDIVIPLYKEDKDRFETVSAIEAVVFYHNDQGRLMKSELNKKDIFKENSSKYLDLVKFALPNIQDGCVIEYKYEIESPFIFNFRPWDFQWDIPKMKSEYIALIPATYNYNVSLIGPYKLSTSDAKIVRDCFQPGGGYKADCSKMTYGMVDIPAFIEEDFMTAPTNFISAINFELSEISLPTGGKRKITNEWKDIDLSLKKHPDFGRQLKRDELFKDRLKPVLAGVTDELERAKAVYVYIKDWFKWNEYLGKYSEVGIKQALENRSGNVGDINLSLVAALSAAGLDVESVVLSTRDNGYVNKLYPVLSDFNYVIAKVNIGETSYYLDATDPLMPFGLLPFRCINDQGRVMSLDKPSYWVDMVASKKRSKVYSLNLVLEADGKIRGTVEGYLEGYEAYNKRMSVKKFNTIDEYVDDLDERMARISIIDHSIQNLDSIESPLVEKYTVEIEAFDDLSSDQLFFSPFFMDRMDENPFKLNDRSYPVDMGAPSNTRIVLSMEFPEEFEVTDKPQNKALVLPNNGGRFISNIQVLGNKIQYSNNTLLEKSVYQPQEYPFLKELFNQIHLLHKTDVVFKKKL